MKTKTEFRYFSIFNHEKEEEYLQEQHKHGWKFIKVTGLGKYHFEECESEDVVYQLDYNPEGNVQKEEYVQMYADCGWEYIQEYAGYSYFRKATKDMNENEEIFCDESSRLAMLERVYKSRLLPLLVIFTACLLPQFVLNLVNGRYVLATFMGGILLVYVVLFGSCAVHYHRKKNGTERIHMD